MHPGNRTNRLVNTRGLWAWVRGALQKQRWAGGDNGWDIHLTPLSTRRAWGLQEYAPDPGLWWEGKHCHGWDGLCQKCLQGPAHPRVWECEDPLHTAPVPPLNPWWPHADPICSFYGCNLLSFWTKAIPSLLCRMESSPFPTPAQIWDNTHTSLGVWGFVWIICTGNWPEGTERTNWEQGCHGEKIPEILMSLTPAWNPCWPLVSFPWEGGSSGLLALPTPGQAHSFLRSLQTACPQRPCLKKQKQPRLGLHAELEVADLSGHLLGRDQMLASWMISPETSGLPEATGSSRIWVKV